MALPVSSYSPKPFMPTHETPVADTGTAASTSVNATAFKTLARKLQADEKEGSYPTDAAQAKLIEAQLKTETDAERAALKKRKVSRSTAPQVELSATGRTATASANAGLTALDASKAQALEKTLENEDQIRLDRALRSIAERPAVSPHACDPAPVVEWPTTPAVQLINTYARAWNPKKENFDATSLNFDMVNFRLTLRNCISRFTPKVDYTTEYGFIFKRNLPKSRIFVRADLHGDLKSLLENLKTLQEQGLLDKNYRCKPDTQLMFLGDYMDRGEYSFEVLGLLAALKYENPENVTLIRGNHESITMNSAYNASDSVFMKRFHELEIHQTYPDILSLFYQTMPLAAYLGQADDKQAHAVDYALFAHAGVEITTDPIGLIDSELPYGTMNIPKLRQLSKRIDDLAGEQLSREIAVLEATAEEPIAPTEYFAIGEKVNAPKYAELNKLNGERATNNGRLEELTREIMAVRIKAMIKAHRYSSEYDNTAYNWVDFDENNRLSFRRTCFLNLSILDVTSYLGLSSIKNSVVTLFRGHEHALFEGTLDNNLIYTTLPIGCDPGNSYATGANCDVSYILQTASHFNHWTKKEIYRNKGASASIVSENLWVLKPKPKA